MFSSNTSQQSEGYQIQRSLRFNSADSAYLNRTPASAGNRKTWTWSGWVKRSGLGSRQSLFGCNFGTNDNSAFVIELGSSDQLSATLFTIFALRTTSVYRDVSAWYHIVVAVDTTQATASNRIRFYVNGTEITAFETNNLSSIAQNSDLAVNSANAHRIGDSAANNWFFNGYMTEVNFIDGQALTPSSFGQTNANTGVWEPKPYAGTYGTNGFYLNFSDNSNTTATTLGKDYSGNGNNWTPNNFSVSAGAGNDSLVDVPTPWGTDTGVGGTVRGNYATLNPLNKDANATLSNGNLDIVGFNAGAAATFGLTTGKWYWEVTLVEAYASNYWGIYGLTAGVPGSLVASNSGGAGVIAFNATDGGTYANGSRVGFAQSGWSAGTVIGLAFDADAMTLAVYRNNSQIGSTLTVPAGAIYPTSYQNGISGDTSASATNFGQRPFAYTAPSGFKALCTQNLPTPTIGATAATQAGKYFNAVTWTGDGSSSRSITGVGFQPDFTWLKTRSNANQSHHFVDVVRGYGTSAMRTVFSEQTNAEESSNGGGTLVYGNIQSLNSDGFTVAGGNTGITDQVNKSSWTYVAWNWKANGAGVTNTAGSITSTVSANTTSGFSIVNWTQPSSGTYTIGHGLGVAPAMIIIKSRTNTSNWAVYHQSLGHTQYLLLNGTNSAATDTSVWVAAPTSTVFSQLVNYGTFGTSIAYCFAEVPGFSKFGSYTGNGSTDGPFVYCGFRPAYVMIKRTNDVSSWEIHDTKRAPFNADDKNLYANLSDAEAAYVVLDELSNGFKLRTTLNGTNASGGTYIFAAFAEAPQKFALAR